METHSDRIPDLVSTEKATEMNTLVEVLEKLRIKKMDNEFRWTPDGFTAGKGKIYTPEELQIIKVYRFEGYSDPAESSVIYIIEANDGLRGYSMNSYGTYDDHADEEGYNNFLRKIPIIDRDDQLLFQI